MSDNLAIAIACDGSHIVLTIFDRMKGGKKKMSYKMEGMEATNFAQCVLREAVILLARERQAND